MSSDEAASGTVPQGPPPPDVFSATTAAGSGLGDGAGLGPPRALVTGAASGPPHQISDQTEAPRVWQLLV
jgi:hypothetical protein